MPERTQIRRGVGLAAAAALSFGATVPLLKLASAGVGVFACGALLYLGAAAAAGAVIAVRPRRDAGGLLRGRALVRLLGLALLGAVCAPALLVVGDPRAGAGLCGAAEAPGVPPRRTRFAAAAAERLPARLAEAVDERAQRRLRAGAAVGRDRAAPVERR